MAQPVPVTATLPAVDHILLLSSVSAQFDAVTEPLAKSGMIGGEALDQHQLLSYELALAASELLAARTLLESPSAVEERLEYPAFAEAKLLVATPMAGNWPARRACAGWDMEQETPVANLWNVGDSVKSYGDGGTQTCADAGRMAAEKAVTSLASFGIADMRDAI